jgi:hypothetical protein
MTIIDAIIDAIYDIKFFIIGSKRIFIEHDINVNNLEQIRIMNHK